MSHTMKRTKRILAGAVLVSSVLLVPVAASAESSIFYPADPDPAHHSTDMSDPDPAHHQNPLAYAAADTDPAHHSTDVNDHDPAHHRPFVVCSASTSDCHFVAVAGFDLNGQPLTLHASNVHHTFS